MMQHYDRTTITEEPAPEKVVIIHSRYRPNPWRKATSDIQKDREQLILPILNADQDQRDQFTTRLSLRREK